MRNFIFKCLVLVFVLYAGILIGIDKTEKKQEMENDSFQISQPQEIIQFAHLPNEVIRESESGEENGDRNDLSNIGKGMANAVTIFTQKTIEILAGFM